MGTKQRKKYLREYLRQVFHHQERALDILATCQLILSDVRPDLAEWVAGLGRMELCVQAALEEFWKEVWGDDIEREKDDGE